MMRFHRIMALCLAVTACTGGQGDDNAAPDAAAFASEDIALGRSDAPVEMIEYVSMTCNHCRTFHKTIFPHLKKEFIDSGKVRFVIREFPTHPTTLSRAQAMLIRCAGDRAYSLLDAFLDRQHDIINASQSSDGAIGILSEISQQHGIEGGGAITACLENQQVLAKVNAVIEQGRNLGVRATPYLFINGQRTTPDKMNRAGITALVKEALAGVAADAQ